MTSVAGQESCGPSCVNLTHKIAGDGRGSLSASFTAGQRGSAKLLWDVSGTRGIGEAGGARTLRARVLARRDSSDPVIDWRRARTVLHCAFSGGAAATPSRIRPGSLVLLSLLILPVVGRGAPLLSSPAFSPVSVSAVNILHRGTSVLDTTLRSRSAPGPWKPTPAPLRDDTYPLP